MLNYVCYGRFSLQHLVKSAMSPAIARRPHFVGTEALLPFAEGDGGRLVHVATVRNGKKCGCICPECRGQLIAYHPRTKKAAYFGHYTASECDPPRARETMLHKLAKQLIEERKEILLPPVVAYLGDTPSELWASGFFYPESVRLEEAIPGMRPDIIAVRGEKTLFIEVAVRHKVGAEKLALIRDRRHPTIEIDLAKWRHETDERTLTNAIIREAPRAWLFNNKVSEVEAAWLAKQEGRARKQQERNMEIADAIVRELPKLVLTESSVDGIFVQCKAAIQEAGMDSEIGVNIPASGAFVAPADIWQSMVLARLLQGGSISAQDIQLDNDECRLVSVSAVVALRDKTFDWAIVERATNGRVCDPRAAITGYLDHLCARNLATRNGIGRYVATWQAQQRADAARQESQAKADRLKALRELFKAVSLAIGAPRLTFDEWMDMRHDGAEICPRELAKKGGAEWRHFKERMLNIQRLATPDAKVVDGPLLGFPAAIHIARRTADARRRQREAAAREAARIAAEKARHAQEAAERLTQMQATAVDAGLNLLHEPLDMIGGRSIAETAGWMSEIEATRVWHWLRSHQEIARRTRAREASARAESDKWREKLRDQVIRLLGTERGTLFLQAQHPKTNRIAPIAFCYDNATFERCITLARGARRNI